jgi:hypothetical protein
LVNLLQQAWGRACPYALECDVDALVGLVSFDVENDVFWVCVGTGALQVLQELI